MKNSVKVREITFIAIFVAIIAVFSQIAIPMPSAVPITLQAFIIIFAGYYLGIRRATIAVIIYILLGAVGVPVFSSFKGGFYVLLGPTGGFIWGFLIVAVLCAIFSKSKLAIPIGVASILACHALGVLQFMIYSNITFWASFVTVSLPYLIKDIAFVPLAYFLSLKISKRIKP